MPLIGQGIALPLDIEKGASEFDKCEVWVSSSFHASPLGQHISGDKNLLG